MTQAKKGFAEGWNLSRGDVALLHNIDNNRVFAIVFNFFSIFTNDSMCSLLAIQKYGTGN